MIKKLHVKNYKSLKDVDIELARRNVLIGPNMSGKSNLIDCFKFLTQMCTSGVSKAFLEREELGLGESGTQVRLGNN